MTDPRVIQFLQQIRDALEEHNRLLAVLVKEIQKLNDNKTTSK